MGKENFYGSNQENEKCLFISWSGPTGERVANLIYEWIGNIYKNVDDIVFLSSKIKSGKQGFTEIMNALGKCTKGLFIMTQERIRSPWIHFEAGAIYKANSQNSVIPVYVDVKRESLGGDPLTEFQSKNSFCYHDLDNLIFETGKGLGWNLKDTFDKNAVQEKFEKKVNDLMAEILPDPVMEMLHQNRQKQYKCYISETSGCLAHLDENAFFDIRKRVVENAKGELIIAGSSLTDALGSGNRSLRDVIGDGVREKRITSIKFLLADLSMFEPYCTESNAAINRVMGSLDMLKSDLFHVCDRNGCDISVYFLPLHNLEHVVLTERYMLYRPTKLWTLKEEYKGEFTLYKNAGDQSEHAVQQKYLRKLMELCTKINFDIDTMKNSQDSYIAKEIKSWRRSIWENGGHIINSENPGELKNIHLYKLYPSQLMHYIACAWNGPNHSELRFTPNKQIGSAEDLFDSRKLLDDSTQRYLLGYIKETETLLRGVMEKYSTASVNGKKVSDAHIYPSLDLGFPNNSVRLAGGFATGMLVTWKCGTPIVPVDATVNVCSSSVFELPENYNMNKTDAEFKHDIKKLMQEATKEGYGFNFASGNHFLMLAEDEKGKKYLVLHSSAKEFKDSYIGLYPVKGNWYHEKIRIYPTPYVRGKRYIRYLKGDDAIFFISLAKKLEEVNVQIHGYFAKAMNATKCSDLKRATYHHYYMPTDSSIAIGTFVEEPGTTVPIFSAPNKAICLFEVDAEQNWTIQLGGKPKCLIPHGWGQSIEGRINTDVDCVGQKFTVEVNGIPHDHDLSESYKLSCPEKHIRSYDSCKEFLENQSFIKGKIVNTLVPKHLYCYENQEDSARP